MFNETMERRYRPLNYLHPSYTMLTTKEIHDQRIPPVSSMLSQPVNTVRPTMISEEEKLAYIKAKEDDRPYHCNACDKKFRQLGHLQQHIRIHTNDRPYQCAHCEKAFKQKSQVNQHERIHTGEKPYQCNICFRAYPQAGQLYSHKKSSHGLDARIKNQHMSVQIEHNKTKRGRKRKFTNKIKEVDTNSIGVVREEGPLPIFVYVLDPNAGRNFSSSSTISSDKHQLLHTTRTDIMDHHHLPQVTHE